MINKQVKKPRITKFIAYITTKQCCKSDIFIKVLDETDLTEAKEKIKKEVIKRKNVDKVYLRVIFPLGETEFTDRLYEMRTDIKIDDLAYNRWKYISQRTF